MTYQQAKIVFSSHMEASKVRKLTAYERGQLARASAVLRRGRHSAMNPRRGNPPKSTGRGASKTVVKIYGRVLRVEAQKTGAHQCDAECRRCDHKYFHDFRLPTGVKMLGLSPGQVFRVPAGCWPILLFAQKGS